MKEKKGRIGRFNLVDVVIVAILLIGAAFLGIKLLGGEDAVIAESVRIEYRVQVVDVDPEVCENIMAIQGEKGQVQLMANGALVDGYVTGITCGPHITHKPNAEGVVVTAEETGEKAHVDMTFTIQAAADSTVTYKVGTQEVRVGKGHIVKTVDYELEGYSTVILSREDLG